MSTSETLLNSLHYQLNEIQDKINWINQIKDKLDTIDSDEYAVSIVGMGIDFDNLPHDKIIKLVQLFSGKWDKEPCGDRVHYIKQEGNFKLRCYAGEPPPNCKVVEVEELIPAQPERIEKRRRLICQ